MTTIGRSMLLCSFSLMFGIWVATSLAQVQTTRQAHELCRRVREIRTLPLKAGGPNIDYSSVDPVYGQMRKMGDQVVPCLIDEISDVTEMDEPEGMPPTGRVMVGDVAFWVVRDITGLPYDDMFPSEVRKRFATEGVYAYFAWIKSSKHRKLLQQNVRDWYARHRQ